MTATSARTPSLLPRLRSWWWCVLAVALFAGAITGGLLAKSAGRRTPELQVDIDLSHDRSPLLTGIAQGINYGLSPAGGATLVLLGFAVLLFVRRAPVQALAFASVVCIGWFSSELGKRIVERLRPPSDAVAALIAEHGPDSFPSGHTSLAVALAWAVLFLGGRSRRGRILLGCAGALFVAIVACSRMYLGVHYPTDVLGAVVIATSAILAWLPIWNNLFRPRLARFNQPETVPASAVEQVSSPAPD